MSRFLGGHADLRLTSGLNFQGGRLCKDMKHVKRLAHLVEELNIQKTSRKAWNLQRKLNDEKTDIKESEISPDEIVRQTPKPSNVSNRDKSSSKKTWEKRTCFEIEPGKHPIMFPHSEMKNFRQPSEA